MNKTQLIEQFKKPVDHVDSLLNAAGISTNLETYTAEHLKTLQALDEMVASGLAKTHKDAASLYRQQQESSSASEPIMQAQVLDEFIIAQAERAADAALRSFPQIAIEEYYRLKELFVQRYRQHIAKQLQNPEFRQQFQAAMEGQNVGKLNLNSMTSNTALPSSLSSSS